MNVPDKINQFVNGLNRYETESQKTMIVASTQSLKINLKFGWKTFNFYVLPLV